MAHVTGGIAGYLFGIIFLQKMRADTCMMQEEADREALRARIALLSVLAVTCNNSVSCANG